MRWCIFLVFVAFGVAVAQQDDNHGHQVHHDDGTIISSNGSDKSYILGLGGSDMEIGDCLATYSFLFGIWQNVKVNPLCEADKMDAQGNHQGAAEMRCSTHKYEKVYGKGQDCIDAVIYVSNNPEPAEVDEWDNKWEEKYLAQQQEIEMIREESASRVAATTRKQLVLEAKLDADADRRARARAARDEVLNKGSE